MDSNMRPMGIHLFTHGTVIYEFLSAHGQRHRSMGLYYLPMGQGYGSYGVLILNLGDPMDSSSCPMGKCVLPMGLSCMNIGWSMDRVSSPMVIW
jgi:hypothetical protein